MQVKLLFSIAMVASLALIASEGHAQAVGSSARHEEINRLGSIVMPFDLSRTTHYFDDTPNGGIETITANMADDREQVSLIREHLQKEARQFGHGDFSDPMRIHGRDMPGAAVLASAGADLSIRYATVPGGASITYVGHNDRIAKAVHEWFAAQRSDHNAHMRMHQ